MAEYKIRNITPEDYGKCTEIYNWYIENTTATLEMEPLSVEEFSARAESIRKDFPYIVCENEGRVIGYAYLSWFNEREGYRYTADLSIYLDNSFRGHGAGTALYRRLEEMGRKYGFTSIVGLVTDENDASRAFHKKQGFREAGHLDNIAFKFGRLMGLTFFVKHLK